jgi:hypothetical protein
VADDRFQIQARDEYGMGREPIPAAICTRCGAVVSDKDLHARWHSHMANEISVGMGRTR